MNVELFEELLNDNADYADLADALVYCEWDSSMTQEQVEREIETVIFEGDSWCEIYYDSAWNFLKNVDPTLSQALDKFHQQGSYEGANVCTLANELLGEMLETQYSNFISDCVDEGVFDEDVDADDDVEL